MVNSKRNYSLNKLIMFPGFRFAHPGYFAAGIGVAGELDIDVSKQGISVFKGVGVGFGFDFSVGGSYNFQDTSGFTSRTSVYSSLGEIPIQIGGSIMVSESGPAYSFNVQPGIGAGVDTVVGDVNEYAWDNIENSYSRMRP